MRSVTFSSGSIVLRMLCRVQQKVLRMILIISINKKLFKVLLPFLLNLMFTKLMGLMALRFFTLKSCVSLRLKLLPTFLTKSFKQVISRRTGLTAALRVFLSRKAKLLLRTCVLCLLPLLRGGSSVNGFSSKIFTAKMQLPLARSEGLKTAVACLLGYRRP